MAEIVNVEEPPLHTVLSTRAPAGKSRYFLILKTFFSLSKLNLSMLLLQKNKKLLKRIGNCTEAFWRKWLKVRNTSTISHLAVSRRKYSLPCSLTSFTINKNMKYNNISWTTKVLKKPFAEITQNMRLIFYSNPLLILLVWIWIFENLNLN